MRRAAGPSHNGCGMSAAAPFGLVARAPSMCRVLELVEKIRGTQTPVLVLGESGTGKNLLARDLHAAGPRASAPYLEIPCANLSDELLESELFGHERGAFTGAVERRTGKFELAHGGTVLLDQVTDLSPSVQAKLLRILEEGTFERLGGTETLRADVRLVATTNVDLSSLVKAGRFREDLFYRLNVVQVRVPPLRDRREDILPLAEHFLARYRDLHARPAAAFDEEARELFLSYPWPGNVRELEHVVERAVLLARGERIGVSDLPLAPMTREEHLLDRAVERRMTLEELEAAYIRRVLQLTGGKKGEAARILGIHRKTLLEKRRRHKLE
jgi:DNA-binding NtrC family response regulator